MTQYKARRANNSPPVFRRKIGGVRQSREVDKENHRKQAHKARRAKAPALKFTKEILGEVSRSDGGVKNRSATEGIKPIHMDKVHNTPPVFRRKIGEPRRAHEWASSVCRLAGTRLRASP